MSDRPSVKNSCQLSIGILRRGYSSSGGVEVYLKGLAAGLLAEGHRPVLIGNDAWPSVEWPGGEILRSRGKTPSDYAREVSSILGSHEFCFDLTLSAEKVPGCDIYRTDEGVHAAWLAARSPFLSPTARIFQKLSPKHREKLRLERELFSTRSTRHVIAISERIIREITRTYGYPRNRISLIRNGVSPLGLPSEEDRLAARRLLGIAPGERCVLFVGTGWERKGLRFAVRAVEGLNDPSVRLMVAGRGSKRRHDSACATFLGTVSDMKSLYAAGDLLVAPSIYEPFSLAGLEALGAGLPVIAGKAVGLGEIMVSGVHGEVIDDPSDIESLAGALRKWMNLTGDPFKARSVGAGCVELASQFTLARNLRETLDVILSVAAEKKGRGMTPIRPTTAER